MEDVRKAMTAVLTGTAFLAAILVTVLLATSFVLASGNSATSSWDNATVRVTIGQITMIDITPELMDFGTAYPGDIITQYIVNDGSNNNVQLSAFQIENIGSTNITKIWLNVTQPSQRPFGTGDTSLYDPANWLAVNISFAPGSMPTTIARSYVDRIEFNDTQLVYLKTPSNTKTYGRLRMGENEYFWAINTTGDNCSTPATTPVYFVIGNENEPHNQNQTGDIDLTDGDEKMVSYSTNPVPYDNDQWIAPSAKLTYLNQDYLVYISDDCTKVRFVAWNRDIATTVGGSSLLSNNASVFDSDIAGRAMYPGESMAMNIEMRVPYGVPQYSSYEGFLTVIATTV